MHPLRSATAWQPLRAPEPPTFRTAIRAADVSAA